MKITGKKKGTARVQAKAGRKKLTDVVGIIKTQEGEFRLYIAPGTYQIRVQNLDTEGFILTDSFVVEDTKEPQTITIVADVKYVKGKINLINYCNTDIDFIPYCIYGKLNISDPLSEKLSGASDFQLECFLKNAETYTIDDISLGSTEYGKHMDLTITGNESEWGWQA